MTFEQFIGKYPPDILIGAVVFGFCFGVVFFNMFFPWRVTA